jgi:hypothetical protein
VLAGTPKYGLIKVSLFLIAMGVAVGLLELIDRRQTPTPPTDAALPTAHRQ